MIDNTNQKRTLINLTYGIRSGTIVYISEISSAEKGKKCGCICPKCGAPLIAKTKGSGRRPHFAHAKDSSCDVTSAQQTALHLLAKEIIAREKKVYLPEIAISRPDYSDKGWDWEVAAMLPLSKTLSPARQWTCDSVDVEKSETGYTPDLKIIIQGKPCLIEIAVTHFVDEEKKNKIIDSNMPLVEIDLSDLRYADIDPETLKHLLTESPENRVWIYNPRLPEFKAKAEQWFYEQYEQAKAERDNDPFYQKRKKKENHRAQAEEKWKSLLDHQNYRAALETLRNNDSFLREYMRFSFSAKGKTEVPFYIDLPVTGEMAFQCDRRIWQGKIFDKFIFSGEKPYVEAKTIRFWFQRSQFVKTDWMLKYNIVVANVNGRDRLFNPFIDSIDQYLTILDFLGFISYRFGTVQILKHHTIEPPDFEASEKLRNVLQTTDVTIPLINDAINTSCGLRNRSDSTYVSISK